MLQCCHAAMLPCYCAACCHAAMPASQAGGGGVGQLCLDIDRSTPGLVDQESSLVESFFSLLPFLNKVEEEDWEDDRIYVGLRPGERSFWIWRLVLRLRQTWPDPPRANRCNCDTWRSGTSLPPSVHIFTPQISLFIFLSYFFLKKNHISFVFLEEKKHFHISHVLAALLISPPWI